MKLETEPEGTSCYHLGVAILAAGRSERMGKQKLLLRWGDSTILGHLIALYRNLPISQIAAVCSKGDAAVESELEKNGVMGRDRIENPTLSPEMYSSVLRAMQWDGWIERITHLAIVLGDQPQINRDTVVELIQLSRNNPERICQPEFNGKRRHPVIVPLSTAREIASREFRHLKAALADNSHLLLSFPSKDEGLQNDIDTPQDYTHLVRESHA